MRSLLRGYAVVITCPSAYVRNMSPGEIEEAVKGLNRGTCEARQLHLALRGTKLDPVILLAPI
jgi:hypothetical protein